MNAPVSLQSLAAGWTEERVELLTKLHREGLSCAQIAKRLHGVTRNAVIGKVSRLGLNGAAAPRKASAPGARKPPSVPRPPRAPKPQPVEIASGHFRTPPVPKPPKPVSGPTQPPTAAFRASAFAVTPTARHWLTRADGECRWPVGEPETPAEQMSCCAPSGIEHYCAGHARLASKPATTTGRKPAATKDPTRLARRYA
jgi:GcrA cell cycle regulator